MDSTCCLSMLTRNVVELERRAAALGYPELA
jgi:hypothetical protein